MAHCMDLALLLSTPFVHSLVKVIDVIYITC